MSNVVREKGKRRWIHQNKGLGKTKQREEKRKGAERAGLVRLIGKGRVNGGVAVEPCTFGTIQARSQCHPWEPYGISHPTTRIGQKPGKKCWKCLSVVC